MAHTEFMGVSASTAATYDAIPITGWQEITIAEKFKPLPEQVDVTHAGDAAYVLIDHPLGGKGSDSCQVTIAGLLSVTDHEDAGLLSRTIDAIEQLIVTTKALGDKFTLASATFKGVNVGAAFGEVQPFTATFSDAATAGAWSTAT
jgi:hypothetical protein